MKIPPTIKIGGHIYDIEYHCSEMIRLAGMADGEENVIHINERFADSKKESILFHEIVHTIDWMNDLKLTEQQTASISEGMYAVLKDNKLLK